MLRIVVFFVQTFETMLVDSGLFEIFQPKNKEKRYLHGRREEDKLRDEGFPSFRGENRSSVS